MTNLLATLTLVLATNWTGFNSGKNELGYVVTNHVATIVYEGQTNQLTLKTTVSEIAAWRVAPAPMPPIWYMEPSIPYITNFMVLTNKFIPL